MATAKQVYLAKKLEEKYGAIGSVAGRYLEAGLSIEINHPTRYGPIHIVARGGKSIYAIEVVDKPEKLSLDVVRNLVEKAKTIKAKPILVLYSNAVSISDEIYKFCIDNGVKIKLFRSGRK